MSLFNVQINFHRSQLPENFLNRLSHIIAEVFSQDIEDIGGDLIENCNLLWSGTSEPAIYIVFQSTQYLNEEFNRRAVEAVSKYVSQASSVSASRIFINIVEKALSDVAVNGSLLWESS